MLGPSSILSGLVGVLPTVHLDDDLEIQTCETLGQALALSRRARGKKKGLSRGDRGEMIGAFPKSEKRQRRFSIGPRFPPSPSEMPEGEELQGRFVTVPSNRQYVQKTFIGCGPRAAF